MDQTDINILNIIQNNGRITMRDLGNLVSLSPPAVAERVKRLEEKNIIMGYKTIINYEKLGKSIKVLVNVDIKVEKQKKFLNFIKSTQEIVECFHVTGPYSMIITAYVSSTNQLSELIGKVQAFGNTETFIVLSDYNKNVEL